LSIVPAAGARKGGKSKACTPSGPVIYDTQFRHSDRRGTRKGRGRAIRRQKPRPDRKKALRAARGSPVPGGGGEAPDPQDASGAERREGHSARPLFIAGVGASAGGLEAFTQLLKALPPTTGIAFVLVQHLAPKHESLLSELLGRATSMPVTQATEGDFVAPNHVYVIPPNVEMAIRGGRLHLMPRSEAPGPHLSIDMFLRSLADDQQNEAIGILLSGASSDGALGMAAIRAAGGITIAQEEQSAKYGSMPHSAIAAGVVDFILAPENIARELVRIAGLPWTRGDHEVPFDGAASEVDGHLGKIYRHLHSSTGVDFSLYKQNTIKRRIKRRMVLHRLERLEDYLVYLRAHPEEAKGLYEEMLVNVTGFFREPESFEVLNTLVFPAICGEEPGPVRIWVPGCSTGEEAYSIAISLLEFLGDRAPSVPLQMFATDLSERAVEVARLGVYRENIAGDVSAERLRRFFVKVEGGYQISKAVRDACVFAHQDVTKDPPFSKLDLISCRNVLIYLGPVLQRQVVPIFHYALKPNRYLVLGNSESVVGFSDLFDPVDRKNRVFIRKTMPSRVNFDFAHGVEVRVPKEPPAISGEMRRATTVQREADRLLLARYAPVGVLITESMQILQVRGHTGAFLEPAPGQASVNLLRMAREGLPQVLKTTVQKAIKTQGPVRRNRVPYLYDGEQRLANLEVLPVALTDRNTVENFYLVTFEAVAPGGRPAARRARPQPRESWKERGEAGRLRRELTATKDYLQSMIEELEATNEEIKSANEEILSSNEELQSTNEELETAKEELQSGNEELTTVNEELQNRNLELSQTNNDLTNVLASVNLPILIIGSDLRIRRFTPAAEKLLNLIPADMGRRVTDIKPNVAIVDLEATLLAVMETVSPREDSVRDDQGRWYSMRVRPYRTLDNRIDGAILMLVDVSDLRGSLQQLAESRNYAQAIVETMQEGFLVLDEQLRVRSANQMFYKRFGLTPEQTLERPIDTIGSGAWNIPRLTDALRSVVAGRDAVEHIDLAIDFPAIGRRNILMSVRRLEGENQPGTILCSVIDITDLQRAEKAVRDLSAHLLQLRDEEQRRIARELHDSTAQGLAAIALNLELVATTGTALTDEQKKLLSDSRTLAEQCSRELRDISELLHPPMLEEAGLGGAVKWYVDSFERRSGVQVSLHEPENLPRLPEPVETALFRVIQESLTNVQRHSGSRTAEVSVELQDGGITVRVGDRGRGLPAGSVSSGVSLATLGVGIAGMRARVKQLNGMLTIQSGSWGTRVQAHIPLPQGAS
jgi:two-component system CheB/CheR fusion protein